MWVRLAAATVLLAGLWALARGQEDPAGGARRPAGGDDRSQSGEEVLPAPDVAAPHYVGTASCAASNCHGGDGSGSNRPRYSTFPDRSGIRRRRGDGTWGAEYTVWLQKDPHARARAVLFDETSRRMAERLGIEAAHEADRCLNCHAVNDPTQTSPGDYGPHGTLADGVGCEACHGPASEWLDLHKQSDWPRLSAERKRRLGFLNTDDVLVRTRMCATCHVGGPGRDVDHDLIAAGHPRLNFEAAAYDAMLPHHWDESANLPSAGAEGPADLAAFETRLWAVGQLTSAEAAVAQLRRRAADDGGPWPEFAEYGCFACHHDLRAEVPLSDAGLDRRSWRQSRGFVTERAGHYPWGTWYTPSLHALQTVWPSAAPDDVQAAVQSLQDAMGRPRPARDTVRAQAQALEDVLRDWSRELNRLDIADGERGELFSTIRSDATSRSGEDGTVRRLDWDTATQVWLALAALQRAARHTEDPPDEATIETLKRIRELLEFPEKPRYQSPRGHGRRVDDIRDLLHAL